MANGNATIIVGMVDWAELAEKEGSARLGSAGA